MSYVSMCCGYSPDDRFELSGDTVGIPIGICSYCKEHTGFEESEDE